MHALRANLDALGRCRVIGAAEGRPLGDDVQRSAVHVCLVVGLQALAAAAGALQQHGAAVLGVGAVALHGCRALGLALVAVVGAVAGGDDGGASSVDDDVALAVDALACRGAALHVQYASVDVDAVVGLDAVVGRRLHVDVTARAHDDVVSTVYAVVVAAVHLQCSCAVQQQLTLAVEGSLVVGLRRGSVAELAGGVAGQHHEGALLAEQVQRCRVGVGNVGAAEHHLVLLLAQYGERAVGGRSADVIAHALRLAVVGHEVCAVGGDGHSVGCGIADAAAVEHDVDGGVECVLCQVVLLVGEVLSHGGVRLVAGGVDVYCERDELARAGRGSSACTTSHRPSCVAVVGGSIPFVYPAVVLRLAALHACRCCEQHEHSCHYLLHSLFPFHF